MTTDQRLARARTAEWLANERLAALPDGPAKTAVQRRLRAASDKLRGLERAFEASK